MRIGIVTGMPQELAAFAPEVPGTTALVGGVRLRTLRIGAHEVALACAGIGKVAAATAAGLLHARHDAALLMVIGTAAALDGGPARTWRIAEAVQHDYGARRPTGFARYAAGAIPIGPDLIAPLAATALPGPVLPAARIASGDMFVESASHAAEIGRALGATLIDMETAAVAQAGLLLGVPWAAIKASTDAACEASAQRFEANLMRAAAESAGAARKAIAALPENG